MLEQSKLTPKRLIMRLLRASGEQAIPVKALVEAGVIFGFKASNTRVALTRLLRDGLVESDERGFYRLSAATTPLSAFIERWREGEDRLRPWNSAWLAVHLPRSPDRSARKRSLKVLDYYGFAAGLDGIWVRPDNLNLSRAMLEQSMHGLGLELAAQLFRMDDCAQGLQHRWCHELWPVTDIEQRYDRELKALYDSALKIHRLPLDQALIESFLLGGRAVFVLALDPLLPDAIINGSKRAELHQAMLDYDDLGRSIWSRFPDVPIQPQAQAAAERP